MYLPILTKNALHAVWSGMRYRLQTPIIQRDTGSEQILFLENDVADRNQERRGDTDNRESPRPRLHTVWHIHAEEA